MIDEPKKKEIEHHTIKLIVGVIAVTLASVTNYFSQTPLDSISASYHVGGWARDIFVGFLFAISAFLLAYNGKSKLEMIISKVAALSALGVALFPCVCDGQPEIIPYVHYISAIILFVILTVFCFSFYERAKSKPHIQAQVRSYVYAGCGAVITLSILVLALDFILDDIISFKVDRLTYYGEKAGLMAFGIAWLTASRMLPVITSSSERLSILTETKDST